MDGKNIRKRNRSKIKSGDITVVKDPKKCKPDSNRYNILCDLDSDSEKINMETEEILKAIRQVEQKLDNHISEQNKFRTKVEEKLLTMQQTIKTEIQTECRKLKLEFSADVKAINQAIEKIELDMKELDTIVKTKIDTIEGKVAQRPMIDQYNPEVTIVGFGIAFEEEENILKKSQDLIKEGLGLQIDDIRAMRTPNHGDKPGVVKIQMPSKETKIAALKVKRKLRDKPEYKKVFIRGAQTHEERLLHMNTATLLKELNLDHKFRTTGSGRLVQKREEAEPLLDPANMRTPDGPH